MGERKPTHFWEGKDSRDRLIRATFLDEKDRGRMNHISWDAQYPLVVFRAQKEWKRPYAENSEEWATTKAITADMNEARLRSAARAGKTTVRLRPQPRYSGTVFSFLLAMSLKDFQYQAGHGIALGLEEEAPPFDGAAVGGAARRKSPLRSTSGWRAVVKRRSSPRLRKSHEVQPKETP